MAVRIFNRCTNTHYLYDMGIDGLSLSVNDGKDSRHVCACGWVDKGEINTCPNCGNTHWSSVSANRWGRSSAPIDIKAKELEIRAVTDGFEIVETILMIQEVSKQLELSYQEHVVASIDEFNLEIQNRRHVCIGESEDVSKYIFEHVDDFPNEAVQESIREAMRVAHGVWNRDDYLALSYRLIGYASVMHLLTDENIAKYNKFFRETISRNDWYKGDPYAGKACWTMEDLWKVVGLPVDYAAYYASDDFSYGYYYYSRNNTSIDEAKLHALPEELQRTMRSCLEHKTISLSVIREILSWSETQTEETLVLLAKFMKRHGMQYQGRVFDHFRNYLQMAKDMGYDVESILQPRKFSMLEAMTLLKRRGYPDSRVDAFCDAFDVNPAIGLSLLGSKAQLKKAEADKIYNK